MSGSEAGNSAAALPSRGGVLGRQLQTGIFAGLICGLLAVVNSVSNAALIFNGELAPAFATGAGLALFGTCVLGLIISLGSSYRGAIATVALAPASILGLVANAVLSARGDLPVESVLPTVLAAILLTSILTGLFLYVLGAFHLGSLPRYIPFPVIGGFLGGVGWLLVLGSLEIATNLRLSLSQAVQLLEYRSLMHLAPAFALCGVLLWAQRRFPHFLVMPGIVLGAIALFYAAALATGQSAESLRASGWLMAQFSEGALWPPAALATVGQANLPALLDQLPRIGTILIISVLTLLLYATSLDLVTGQEIDPDRELRVSGVANLAAGLGGGMPGHIVITLSMLAHRMTPGDRKSTR